MGKQNEVMFDKPFLKVIQTQHFYILILFLQYLEFYSLFNIKLRF